MKGRTFFYIFYKYELKGNAINLRNFIKNAFIMKKGLDLLHKNNIHSL